MDSPLNTKSTRVWALLGKMTFLQWALTSITTSAEKLLCDIPQNGDRPLNVWVVGSILTTTTKLSIPLLWNLYGGLSASFSKKAWFTAAYELCRTLPAAQPQFQILKQDLPIKMSTIPPVRLF